MNQRKTPQHKKESAPEAPQQKSEHKPERLQKVMAAAGLGSRRMLEKQIKNGDGQVRSITSGPVSASVPVLVTTSVLPVSNGKWSMLAVSNEAWCITNLPVK